MKQTAVEWLANEFYEKLEVKGDGALFNDLVNQAKELQKQQQDEFAIGFTEWCIKNAKSTYYRGDGALILYKKSYHTISQLLEIYKKEKGL